MPFPHFSSREFYEKYHYNGELGAIYHPTHTTFRVWAPTAAQVWLVVYNTGSGGHGTKHPLHMGINGTWSTSLNGDCHGLFYNYRVLIKGVTNEAVDPYAKACGVNGERGMVVDPRQTNPAGWDKLARPPLNRFVDAIIYELHIRDISIHPKSGITHRGKFLGLTETDTVGPGAIKTGLDHLKDLGITHVQLMPCYDFATVDETRSDGYNWGYDPLNYNVPEGSYATDPYTGTQRILEFKQLIQALKAAGIRVNMDVVYNHTFYTQSSHFNKLIPGYYYRQNDVGGFADGSGCGNELATERSMVRKMILDSVTYWAKEYKIDGFRFDLMGLMDIPTINEIRAALNEIDPTIMMYGEGWTGGYSPLPDNLKGLKGNVRELPGTGVFNDDLRDGLRGHVFFAEQPGFINGGVGKEESVKLGIVGAVRHDQVDYGSVIYTHEPWAAEPAQSINYAEAHDNLTLWDKLAAVCPNAESTDLMAMQKLCGAIILTSQGIPFLHAGMEFLRTKMGDANSYKSPDHINWIDWGLKQKHYDIFQYYRGLITLRRYHPAFRMTQSIDIQNHLRFLNVQSGNLLAYSLGGNANNDSWKTIVVIFNANQIEKSVTLPADDWIVVVNQHKAGTSVLDKIEGRQAVAPAMSALVLVDAASYYKVEPH
ncbi:MAG: type I pullulanase [Firmicutes bacterium]|nr:type I pullulanase [Bacillota bacterium]